ncbi:CRISPR-associated helicase Cas3' [Curvibacter sp. RS43]|uniref:CRISPR-associated helicase Cas3' n=1 Tax=Curvibacter microcysteis TaxID=3026419 RepID=UPI0023606772|nr:CRISPR-associated helicase Cas3' [Curvibacter sp. RS43]MDD0811731.1 CRISPR-associated helicase Cas3' [Curvibacter sp. RS43]
MQRAEQVLANSGVLPPTTQSARSFSDLFPHIAQPSPLQSWAISADLAVSPQIHLLEDVTGAGKTEAAVMLAHRLMAAGCGDGFFVGLPTMATANAMFGRVASVIDKLLPGDVSLVLAHARKTLVGDFAASIISAGQDEGDAQQEDETATHRCTRWLADHNKRALLAPAGVGTVDQVLLAALQSKHQSLRLLGLAHKILLVDEVHACDDYMLRTLEQVLVFHARAGGSAILLSATLPLAMKEALLKAFAKGVQQRVPTLQESAYPLVTSWAADNPSRLIETALETRPEVRRTVTVRYQSELAHVVQGVVEALARGQCVAWIRNTVGDALAAWELLAQSIPVERMTLFHARFCLGDRLDTEEEVLASFGRDSGTNQRAGRLLIATQVAEQSLDVDFDLLVTDLAPMDRIIQRAGRLHRHVRDAQGARLTTAGAQDQRGAAQLWVLGPAWSDAPEAGWFTEAFPRAGKVYPDHGQLWRTARWLRQGQMVMPDDARRWIESVFADDGDLPAGLEKNVSQAQGQGFAARSQAGFSSVKLNRGYQRDGLEWAADSAAPSRLGEDTVDVLLARWVGDVLRPWREDKPASQAWAYSTVRVAKRQISATARPTSPPRAAALDALLQSLPGGGQWVVVLPMDEVDGHWAGMALASAGGAAEPILRAWRYDPELGLTVEEAPGEKSPGALSPKV